jgi:hypothetical protein
VFCEELQIAISEVDENQPPAHLMVSIYRLSMPQLIENVRQLLGYGYTMPYSFKRKPHFNHERFFNIDPRKKPVASPEEHPGPPSPVH